MSDFRVIGDVDQTLAGLLSDAIDAEAPLQALLAAAPDRIVFDSPGVLIQANNNTCVSLFLYRVSENPDLKNRPPVRVSPHLMRQPPLALNLHYLLTPLLKNTHQSHWLLGRLMQELADRAIVRGSALAGGLRDNAEELRISLESLSLEELTKLWTTFGAPYRLGVTYEVRVALLDSARFEGGERVRLKRLELSQGVPTP